MAIPQAPEHFTIEFDGEVMAKFRNEKSGRLKDTVRVKNGTRGKETRFKLIGESVAQRGKPRGERLEPLNPPRSVETIIPEPWYAPHSVEDKDLTRLDHDDKAVLAINGADALNKALDQQIIGCATDAATGGNVVGNGTTKFTLSHFLQCVTQLQTSSKLAAGDLYAILDPVSFNIMMTYDQFVKSDYVPGFPLESGRASRMFNGINVLMVPDDLLPITTGTRKLPFYHKMAIGLAMQQDMTSIWSWENAYDYWFVNMSMDFGRKALQPEGCVVAHVLNSTPADVYVERDAPA
jgi:hypothetical protein